MPAKRLETKAERRGAARIAKAVYEQPGQIPDLSEKYIVMAENGNFGEGRFFESAGAAEAWLEDNPADDWKVYGPFRSVVSTDFVWVYPDGTPHRWTVSTQGGKLRLEVEGTTHELSDAVLVIE